VVPFVKNVGKLFWYRVYETPRFREMSAVDHTIAKFIHGQNSLSHIFKMVRDKNNGMNQTRLIF